MRFSFCLALIVHLFAAAESRSAGWTIRKDGRSLRQLVWTGSKFVGVGEGSAILVSDDGTTWKSITGVTNADLVDLVWSGKQLVGFGTNATLIRSWDGINWRAQSGAPNYDIKRLLWTGTSYLVFDGCATTYVLDDSLFGTGFATNANGTFQFALWDGKQAVLGWKSASGKDSIATSPDGKTWSRVATLRTSNPISVKHDSDGYFGLIGDSLALSKDLITWKTFLLKDSTTKWWPFPTLVDRAYGRYIVSGKYNPYVIVSVDGSNWSRVDSLHGHFGLNSGTLSCARGFFLYGTDGTVFGTTDSGKSWKMFRDEMGNYLEGVVWDGTNLNVFGNYLAHLTSPDGKSWNILEGRHYDPPVGYSSAIWSGDTIVTTMPNEGVRTGETTFDDSRFLNGYWDGHRFVQVGYNGHIATSPDGNFWSVDSIPWPTTLRAGTYANGLHVVVGDTAIAISVDAIHWTKADNRYPCPLNGVAWGAGKWVAVGPSGIVSSPDAKTWSYESLPLFNLRTVRWAGDRFVAIGDNGYVLSSSNGAVWKDDNVGASVELDDLVWTGTGMVAVGQYGTIFTWGDTIVPMRTSEKLERAYPGSMRRIGERITLPAWTESVEIRQLDGRLAMALNPAFQTVSIAGLPSGVWIVRARGNHREELLKTTR